MSLAASLLPLVLFACTTTSPPPAPTPLSPPTPVVAAAVPPRVVAPPPESAAFPAAPHRAECPINDTVCTMEYNPMVCSSASYAGQILPVARRPIAWGSNTCTARLNLQKEVCAAQLLPSKIAQVQCVPDTSGGHCPGRPQNCPAASTGTTGTPGASGTSSGSAATPSRCTAKRYGTQLLTAEQQLSAEGLGECAARNALHLAACRSNLDPDLLGEISCDSAGKSPVATGKGGG